MKPTIAHMVYDLSALPSDCTEFPADTDGLPSDRSGCRGAVEEADDDDGATIDIVDDDYFSGAFDDAIDEPASPAGGDIFAMFASLLERAAHSMGADEADPPLVRALLGLERAASTVPPEPVVDALQAGDIVQRDARGMARTERFSRQVQGWRGILRGESDDFSQCGAATLDEWASDLLARSLGNAGRAPAIRRELRKLGIAAFGLVTKAA